MGILSKFKALSHWIKALLCPNSSHSSNSSPSSNSQPLNMDEASDQPPLASALSEWKYDVFVSFHGGDSRLRFMSHLFRAFKQANIRCYHDFDRDERGRVVWPMLVDAIRRSRIALILFSPNYARSRWCLDEVVEIVECNKAFRDHGHLVVPIFCDVEPTEVRNQSGVFGRGFDSCVAERGKARAAAWRAALVEAGNRSGWHLKNDANGDESVLIEKIMGQVFSLTSFTNSRHFIKDAVGIDDNASAVISLLDTGSSDDVRVIGLYGIKGIGKTTLAKLVCSRIYFKFEGVSFVENIGDAKYEGIVAFQKTLLDDVSKVEQSVLDDRDYKHNLGLIRDRLCRMKILLVLDNVEEKVQVSQLLLLGRQGGSLGPGSRILVTTRNEELLDQLRVDCKFVVSGLGQEESYWLFSRHAFDGNDEEEGREDLSRSLVYYAGGIPSAIRALGTCLLGKTKDQWGKLLEQFERHPEPDWIEAYSRNLDLFLLPYESTDEPYGGHGGNPYDDGAHRGIRQIEIVVVDGIVGSMRTKYDHNGSLIRSVNHGESHEGQTFKVNLDYPDECLISISGFIMTNTNLRIVQSLSFHSNRRTFGPFGRENGDSFSFQAEHIKGGKIIGFFGRDGLYLDSIGAHFGPDPHPYPFKTVGPFGHRDGHSWDDGKHVDVRQIDVVFGSEVNFISVTYDNFGHPTIPFPHGQHGGGKIQSVKLDYPYEYLTSISGYLTQHPGRLVLQSVSFHSNTKKYGPFGQEVGLPFSGPSTGGKIVGFYGSCNGRVSSIGAYLEPVSHKHPIRSIGPFGGDGGSAWDDGQKTGVRKIIVRCGTVIDSIRVEYDDGGATLQACRRGADGGEHLHTVELDYPNEYIVSISGYLGQWGSMYLVNSLTFKSNREAYGPYGSEQGTFFSSPPNIGKIVGFYGRCNLYLDCIGAYFAPTFHVDPIQKIGPYGGKGGSPWDDGRQAGVRQIFISYGIVIDGICCVYDTAGKSEHRGGHGGCSYTIELDYPNEYLISMSGYTEHFGMILVKSLTFQSNKRTFGPFGCGGGTPFSFTSSARKIVGFYGRSGRYLDSIGAYLDPSPNS